MLDKSKLYDVLDFINRYCDENGFPPTVRDICKSLGIKSTATVYDYINRLKSMGLLNKTENKKRAVAVTRSDSVRIPLLGTVTAGQPIFATENYDGYYTLPSAEFKGDGLFMLRVKGESMINAGIFDGDKIVVRRQENAENGDIVVALFDDGISEGATVKRFFRRNGKIVLHPENPTMEDFVLDEGSGVQILGRVIGLLRSM
ncbi:MAG: transcriptional repressor LexA [Candidatus Gallimonas sp.]